MSVIALVKVNGNNVVAGALAAFVGGELHALISEPQAVSFPPYAGSYFFNFLILTKID